MIGTSGRNLRPLTPTCWPRSPKVKFRAALPPTPTAATSFCAPPPSAINHAMPAILPTLRTTQTPAPRLRLNAKPQKSPAKLKRQRQKLLQKPPRTRKKLPKQMQTQKLRPRLRQMLTLRRMLTLKLQAMRHQTIHSRTPQSSRPVLLPIHHYRVTSALQRKTQQMKHQTKSPKTPATMRRHQSPRPAILNRNSRRRLHHPPS